MKKFLSLTLLSAAALALTGCDDKTVNSLPLPAARADTLAYQVTTSLAAIGDLGLGQTSQRQRRISEESKAQIQKLLPTVDRLIANQADFSSQVLAADREGYEFMQTVSFTDITGEKVEYSLYYNVTSKEVEIDGEKGGGRNEDTSTPSDSALNPSSAPQSSSPSDYEEEIKVQGIAVTAAATFDFSGETETELEEGEKEQEMMMKISVDDNNYVKVKQELSVEGTEIEQEFKYEIVENGQRVLSYAIEKESEEQKVENQMKLVFEGLVYRFESYEENGASYIKVAIEDASGEDKLIFKKITEEIDGVSQVRYEEVAK